VDVHGRMGQGADGVVEVVRLRCGCGAVDRWRILCMVVRVGGHEVLRGFAKTLSM